MAMMYDEFRFTRWSRPSGCLEILGGLVALVIVAGFILGWLGSWPPRGVTWVSPGHRLEIRGEIYVLDGQVVPLVGVGPDHIDLYAPNGFYVRLLRNGECWYKPVTGATWFPDAPGTWTY
jgi:hypothetical protein